MMNSYYTSFNEGLDKSVCFTPDEEAISAMAEVVQEDKKTEPMLGRGYLTVQVTTASEAIPLEGAKVIVESVANKNIWTLYTDESGKTTPLEVPAPKKILPQTPENSANSYGLYNVVVSYPGYYAEEYLNIPIFDGIRAIQPAALSPLGDGVKEGMINTTDEVQSYPE